LHDAASHRRLPVTLPGRRRQDPGHGHRPRRPPRRSAQPDLEQKITRDHPELAGHLDAVVEVIAQPDHVEPDTIPAQTRFYRRDVGPSRWLLVVVSYELQPGRIITALANCKDPKQRTP
jgi:hypothetical protein